MARVEIPCQLAPIATEEFTGPSEVVSSPTGSRGPVRISEEMIEANGPDGHAMSAGLTRLAGGASAPTRLPEVRDSLVACGGDTAETAATLGRIRDAMTSLREARVALHSGEEGSADLARISLLDAHRQIQELSSTPGCGSDMAAHLRNRYFGILQEIGTEGMPADLVSEIDNFMVSNPDGSMTVEYADRDIPIEVESEMLVVPEGAHVEPGSTMTCETTAETVEPLPDSETGTLTSSATICVVTPPAE